MRAELAAIAREAASLPRRPRVYFEEWDEPLIGGIAWVDDLIALVGGESIFPELRAAKSATKRILDPAEVVRRDPEIIVASWCGKRARLDRIAARPGWEAVSAVRAGRLHEIKSPDILAPGLSLRHGAHALAAIVRGAAG
jgi:iron complex transport system substrate-binding protein